jgi:hypothetical protein
MRARGTDSVPQAPAAHGVCKVAHVGVRRECAKRGELG